MEGNARRRVGLRNQSLIAAAPAFILGLIVLEKARTVEYVLTSDMAHYLADADALFGNGVRDLRHLPVYPAVLGLIRLPMSDLVAVRAGLLFVMLALYVAGLVVFGDRVHHPLAGVLGAGMLAACPVVAEGLAWGGDSMLLGFALALVAMHFADRTLHGGDRNSVVLAALFSALTVLTHPLPAAMLAAICVAMSSRQLGQRIRRREPLRDLMVRLAVVGGAAVVALALTRRLYFTLEQPGDPSLSFERLSLLWDWAFRDLWVFWLPLVFVGAVVVPLRGGALRSLGAWSAAITAITLVQTAALGGSPSYVTRPLYSLCFPAALGATWIVERLLDSTAERDTHRLIATSLGVLAIATAFWSFQNRMGVALPYYNKVTTREMGAINFVGEQHDAKTVLVSAKGQTQDAGTLYSWIFEGLARVRAIGPGHRFLYLLAPAVRDSDDAERFFAGETVFQSGRLRVGRTGDFAQVQMKVGDDWEPLAFVRGLRPTASVQVGASDRDYSVVITGQQVGALVEIVSSSDHKWALDENTASISVRTASDDVSMRVDGFVPGLDQSSDDKSGVRVLAGNLDDATSQLRFTIRSPHTIKPSSTRVYSTGGVLTSQHITHVVSWTASPEFAELSRRQCLTREYQNGDMAVWRVASRCRG